MAEMGKFSGLEPLHEIRAWLKDKIKHHEPVECPACHQVVALRARTIHGSIARSMLAIYRAGGTQFVHAGTAREAAGVSGGRDDAMPQYWDLIERPTAERREDGGATGQWRVTEKGEEWLKGEIVIPKHAWVYNKRAWFFDGDPGSGREYEPWSVKDALGEKFDLRDVIEPQGSLV